MYYILEGHKPIKVDNFDEWGRWFETAERHVAKTDITLEIMVSTVFLGTDHNYTGKGKPILFETMVFGGDFDENMERYETWEDAEKGHERWVAKVKNGIQEKEA